jgi:hypothetical protein
MNVLASIAAAAPFVRYSYSRANEFRTPFSKEQNEKVQPYFAVACVNGFVDLGTRQETEDAR